MAVKKIGYVCNKDTGSGSLGSRLERINTKSVIEIARELLKAKLINKQTIINILNKQVSDSKGHNTQITNGKYYLYYAKALVTSSIGKFGTRQKSAKKLGVTIKTINYWVNLKVIDIRIKPKKNRRYKMSIPRIISTICVGVLITIFTSLGVLNSLFVAILIVYGLKWFFWLWQTD